MMTASASPRPGRIRFAGRPTPTERFIDVALDLNPSPNLDLTPGTLPASMSAWVIREERQGEPIDAFKIEEIEVPEPGPFEVVVRVMAAGVNYNNVWAALGQPISVFRSGDHPQYGHHIGGSDGSGIVWKVGPGVTRWNPGDEVVMHCNQASYEDPEVHGLDPLAAPSQRIWGYETTWGSFAEFTKVQAQQLLPKPPALSWEEAGSYGLVYFTAYRMLIGRCALKAGDRVLIWGAAGGLGVFATQLCAAAGAQCVGVVSSEEKGRLVIELGASGFINRNDFAGMMRKGGESAEQEKARFGEMRRFAKAVKEILGEAPDIVFEHVGKATFPTSVFTVRPFGKVVICAGTTGFDVDFDVRYLWMRQKQIVGSHFANAYDCLKANELIDQGRIRPVLWRTFGFEGVGEAHQLMRDNKHLGKIAILVGATAEGRGRTAEGPGAIHAKVGA
jgi:crotonyl-CoA carboxylase/reductase